MTARRWLVFLSAAIAVIAALLAVLLPATPASAQTGPEAGNGIGASHPAVILTVRVSHRVSAGEGRCEPVWQAGLASGACVAAEDTGDAFAGLNVVRSDTGAAVAARLDVGDESFTGTNLARGNAPIKGTFSFFVQHAEGDAFSQALSNGEDFTGQSGTLYVTRAPCGFCVSSISATARSMGLSDLTIVTPDGVFGVYSPETGVIREP